MSGRMSFAIACLTIVWLEATEQAITALPAPLLSPIESTIHGIKIKVALPERDDAIMFKFLSVNLDKSVALLQGPSESSELQLNRCSSNISAVIVSYTEHGIKSSSLFFDIERAIFTEFKPREPEQHMVDGKIHLINFRLEMNALKYFYIDWDVRQQFGPAPDDGVIKVGCNVDEVYIYAKTHCNKRSQSRRVKIDQGQCPPAPIVSIIDDKKIIVDQPAKDDSIRFNFMGFDKNHDRIFNIHSRKSNELRYSKCSTRGIIVWYDNIEENIASISTHVHLPYEEIKNFAPQQPQQQIVGDMVHLTNFLIQDLQKELTYYYIPYGKDKLPFINEDDFAKYDNFALLVPDDNIVKVGCSVDMVLIFARDECRSRSGIERVQINRAKQKVPGYFLDKDRITLNRGKNAIPMKGFVINEKDAEFHVIGPTHSFTLAKKAKVIVRGLGMCNMESDPITVKYHSLSAPRLSPIERTDDRIKLKFEHPPKDNATLFKFIVLNHNDELLLLQGPGESNELWLNRCQGYTVIFSYTQYRERSAGKIINLHRPLFSSFVPKEPRKRMVNSLVQLDNFNIDALAEEEDVKYFYTLKTSHGVKQVPSDGVIKVKCNADRVYIYAENSCKERSQSRRVELDLEQCPPAPLIQISGKAIGQLKLTALTEQQRNDSIRFDFLGFDTNYNQLFHLRSQTNNELRVTNCKARIVLVWYEYRSITSRPAPTYLYDYSLEKFAPQEPTQEIDHDTIHLKKFQLKDWPSKLDYYYVPYETDDMIHGGEFYPVPDTNTIEVGCAVNVVRIFARDECHSVSESTYVYIKRDTKKPIYYRQPGLVTLYEDGNSTSFKGFQIDLLNGVKFFEKGSQYHLALGPANKATVQGVGACNHLSDPIEIDGM